MSSYLSPLYRTIKQCISICFAGLFIFVLASSTLLGQNSNNQKYQATPNWLVSSDCASMSFGKKLVVDALGNSYSTGIFSYRLWLDSLPIEGVASVHFSRINHFLSKRDKNGTLLWIRYGVQSSGVHKILLDDFGNIYTIGQLSNNHIIFSSSKDSIIIKNKPDQHARGFNIFICQYDSTGKVIRSKILPSKKGQVPNDCIFDKKGNLFIGGHYIIDPASTKHSYSLIKLNKNWEILWTKEGKPSGTSTIKALALDHNSNLYTIGHFTDSVTFSGHKIQIKKHYGSRSFVVKYNPKGNFEWVLDSFPLGRSYGTDIICDQAQNVYALFHTTYSKTFLIKLNSNRQAIWSKEIKGMQHVKGIVLDESEHVYLFGDGYTGTFGDTKDSDPNFSYNTYSFFIVNYNSYGHLLGLNIDHKKRNNQCHDVALFKNQIIVLGTHPGFQKVNTSTYTIRPGKSFSVWLASFNTDDFAIKSQDH